jgi:pantoate--beta-alanine ligase
VSILRTVPAKRTRPALSFSMQLITDLTLMQNLGQSWKGGQTVGFVPTMGALHAGHLSLVARSKAQCNVTVVSIFVNPAQFGPQEDLSNYPRDLDHDLALLEQHKVDYVFFPTDAMMYPTGYKTWIEVEQISSVLCGASRPGHFKGVATIVAKLVHLVNPDFMFMGEKDFQQIIVLETMLKDLNFHTRIVRCPIVRESDGLALSSRNKYLSKNERKKALCLSQALKLAQNLYQQGETKSSALKEKMTALIEQTGGQIDYISFVNQATLMPVKKAGKNTRIILAVYIGRTRLIDNSAL